MSKQTRLLFAEKTIQKRIHGLAQEIAKKYLAQGVKQDVVLLSLLKGAAMFTNDLQRALWKAGLTKTHIEYLKISSYGTETQSSGKPQIVGDLSKLEAQLTGKHILVVE